MTTMKQDLDKVHENVLAINKFANGTDIEDVSSPDGASYPTIQKFLKTKDDEINTGADSILAKSQQWAEEEEDVEVEPGAYSALHHAKKAAASAASNDPANIVHKPGSGQTNEAGTVYDKDVTTSSMDDTLGRILKVGDIKSVGDVDYRHQLTGGGALLANKQHHILDSSTYTLPDTTSLSTGTSVVISKAVGESPVIDTFGAEQIATDAGTSASITLSSDSETIFIWNGTNWERVASDDTNGFSQSFSSSGYQVLPSGLIIQWGSGIYTVGSTSVSLPISYPNNHLQAFATGGSSSTANSDFGALPASLSALTVYAENASSRVGRWFSVGN